MSMFFEKAVQSENATTTVDMWLARPPFYPASIRYFLIFSLRIVLCPREDFLGASFSLAVLSSVSAQKKPIGRAFSSSMCRNRRIVRRPCIVLFHIFVLSRRRLQGDLGQSRRGLPTSFVRYRILVYLVFPVAGVCEEVAVKSVFCEARQQTGKQRARLLTQTSETM